MDIYELERSLPNGFHDGELSRMTVDYVARTLDIELSVWVGDVGAASYSDRERMRPAALHLTGLLYCVSDPPDPRYPYAESRPLSIDVDEIDPKKAPPLPQNLPPDAFSFRVWVSRWNGFLYIAARDARLEWHDTPA